MGLDVAKRMNASNAVINQWTIELLPLRPRAVILEIGMGNGFFVKDILAADETIRYVGCDFSETMVEEAQALNREFVERGQAQFMLATADNLPVAAATFDAVFTINTIYFWKNPAAELAEIRRVLKPDGQLLVGIRSKASMQKLPFTQYGFQLFTSQELQALLEENSFTVTNLIEREEPESVIGGHPVTIETIIAVAKKNNFQPDTVS